MTEALYSPALLDFLYAPARSPDPALFTQAQEYQNNLTKPPGSLGRLELLAAQLASLQHRLHPKLDHIMIRIFAADHGVVAEGVSAFPQAVTGEMIKNFSTGGAAITVLARFLNADFGVINLGTINALPELPHVQEKRIAAGTQNFCTAPAMTPAQVEAALLAGKECALTASDMQTELFIGGEMGIGNTTAAAALACAILKQPAGALVGKGTGVDAEGLQRKISVVERALELHQAALTEPLATLQALGGLEIAGLAGAMIGCAQQGICILVDGFICSAAAMMAVAINPSIRPWLVFAHCSAESGHKAILDHLSATPLLDLQMRLGEASGAAVAVPLLRMACELHNKMATFDQAGVSQ